MKNFTVTYTYTNGQQKSENVKSPIGKDLFYIAFPEDCKSIIIEPKKEAYIIDSIDKSNGLVANSFCSCDVTVFKELLSELTTYDYLKKYDLIIKFE